MVTNQTYQELDKNKKFVYSGEYNIYSASLDQARTKFFIFWDLEYPKSVSTDNTLNKTLGKAQVTEALTSSPKVNLEESQTDRMGYTNNVKSLIRGAKSPPKMTFSNHFRNKKQYSQNLNQEVKKSFSNNSNLNFLFKTPLLDSFLQFLFYKENLNLVSNSFRRQVPGELKGQVPLALTSLAALNLVDSSSTLTLFSINQRSYPEKTFKQHRNFLKQETLFFPYGKSFLCYWLIPLMGFISFFYTSKLFNGTSTNNVQNLYQTGFLSTNKALGHHSSGELCSNELIKNSNPAIIYSDFHIGRILDSQKFHNFSSPEKLIGHSEINKNFVNPLFYVLEDYIEKSLTNSLDLTQIYSEVTPKLPLILNNLYNQSLYKFNLNQVPEALTSLAKCQGHLEVSQGLTWKLNLDTPLTKEFNKSYSFFNPFGKQTSISNYAYAIPGSIRIKEPLIINNKNSTSKKLSLNKNIFKNLFKNKFTVTSSNLVKEKLFLECNTSIQFNKVLIGVSNNSAQLPSALGALRFLQGKNQKGLFNGKDTKFVKKSKEEKLNLANFTAIKKETQNQNKQVKNYSDFFLTNPILSYKKASLLLDNSLNLGLDSKNNYYKNNFYINISPLRDIINNLNYKQKTRDQILFGSDLINYLDRIYSNIQNQKYNKGAKSPLNENNISQPNPLVSLSLKKPSDVHKEKVFGSNSAGASLQKIDFLDKVILPLLRNNLKDTEYNISNDLETKNSFTPSAKGTSNFTFGELRGDQSLTQKQKSREQLYKIIVSAFKSSTNNILLKQDLTEQNINLEGFQVPESLTSSPKVNLDLRKINGVTKFTKKSLFNTLAFSNLTVISNDLDKNLNLKNNQAQINYNKGAKSPLNEKNLSNKNEFFMADKNPLLTKNVRTSSKTMVNEISPTQKNSSEISSFSISGAFSPNKLNPTVQTPLNKYLSFLTNTLEKNCSLYVKNINKITGLQNSKGNYLLTPINQHSYSETSLGNGSPNQKPLQKVFRSYMSTKKQRSLDNKNKSKQKNVILKTNLARTTSLTQKRLTIISQLTKNKIKTHMLKLYNGTTNIGSAKQKGLVPLLESKNQLKPIVSVKEKTLNLTKLLKNRGFVVKSIFLKENNKSLGLNLNLGDLELKNFQPLNIKLGENSNSEKLTLDKVNSTKPNQVGQNKNLVHLNPSEEPSYGELRSGELLSLAKPDLEGAKTLGSNSYFNTLIRRKYEEKKYKRKKQRKETRRRKKRKRFYPRPTWLRFRLYKQLCIKLTKNTNSSSKFSAAKLVSASGTWKTFNNLNQTKVRYLFNKYLPGDVSQINNFYKALFSIGKYDQISQNVLIELKRSYWKSYWLRSNLKPYLNRVKNHLSEMKQVKTKWEFYSMMKTFISSLFGFNDFNIGSNEKTILFDNLLTENLNSIIVNKQQGTGLKSNLKKSKYKDSNAILFYQKESNSMFPNFKATLPNQKSKYKLNQESALYANIKSYFANLGYFSDSKTDKFNKDKSNNYLNKWQLITQFSEYNRIMYQQVDNLILNIKENLDINGQSKARSYHIGHKKIMPWNLTALKAAGPGDTDNKNQPGQNDFWVNFGKTVSRLSPFKKSIAYYGDYDKLRLYWAMHKTNTGLFKKINKRKDLWITLKNREQSKSNKTKKMFNSVLKKLGLSTIFTQKNSNLSLNFASPLKGLNNSDLENNKVTPLKIWADSNSSLLKRVELALKVSERKLRQKEEKLSYLGFSKNFYFCSAKMQVPQGHLDYLNNLKDVDYKNLKKKVNKKINSAEVIPYTKTFNQFTTDFNYWWNKPNFNLTVPTFYSGISIYQKNNYSSGPLTTEYSNQSNIFVKVPLWLSTFLFHFCAIISLISISQIRDCIKFSLILLSKFSQIYLYVLYNAIVVPFSGLFQNKKRKHDTKSNPKGATQKFSKLLGLGINSYENFRGDLIFNNNSKTTNFRKTTISSNSSQSPGAFLEASKGQSPFGPILFSPFVTPNDFYGALINPLTAQGQTPLTEQKVNSSGKIFDSLSMNQVKNVLFNKVWYYISNPKKEKQYVFLVLVSIIQKFFYTPTKTSINMNAQPDTLALSKVKNNIQLNSKNQFVTLSLIYFYSTLNSLVLISSTMKNSLYSSVLTLVNSCLVLIRSMYTFLEKPGELIIDWMAYAFLVEWSSDLTNTIPDTIDTSLSSSVYKYSRLTRSNIILMPFEQNSSKLGGAQGAWPLRREPEALLELNFSAQMPESYLEGTWLYSTTSNNSLSKAEPFLNNYISLGFTIALGGLLQRHFISMYEIFLRIACQPDTDLLIRQQKGRIFWDIWSDLLVDVAEDSNINISELSNLKEEQNRLLEKLLNMNTPLKNNNKLNKVSTSNKDKVVSIHSKSINLKKLKWGQGAFKRGSAPFLSASGTWPLTSSAQTNLNAPHSALKNTLNPSKLFLNSLETALIKKQNLSLNKSDFLKPKQNNNQYNTNFKNNLDWWQTKDKLLLRWSTSQFLSYQGKDTELFIDLHPPKSLNTVFRSLTSIKYSQSIQQPIGIIMCQIFSGLFSKQIAKNLLVVGSSGNEKSLLIQALAGETENKIITDNAYRYAIVFRGVAVGIKLLRDVFEALTLHTPCIFLLEDIHAIGERRPFLISDDTVATQTSKASESAFGSEREEIHEKNQVIYQLTKHIISHYKKPYKGDFSLLIPTNYFSFELFSNVNNTKTGNRSALMNGARTNLKANPLLTNLINSGNSTNFGGEQGGQKDKHGAKGKGTNSSEQIKSSSLELVKNQLLAPPATSPFSVLVLKEEKKLKPKSLVKELPWIGLPGEQLANVNKANYSIRVKIALLADMVLSNLSVKLDMITDLLVIIDSVKGNRGFVVFATTHVPYILDPALRRPGRFDETISLPQIPTILTRWEILKSNLPNLVSSGKPSVSLVSTSPFYGEAEPFLFGTSKSALTLLSPFNKNLYSFERGSAPLFGATVSGLDFLNIYQNINNLSSANGTYTDFVKNPYNLNAANQNNSNGQTGNQGSWNSLVLNAISTKIISLAAKNQVPEALTSSPLVNLKSKSSSVGLQIRNNTNSSLSKKLYNKFNGANAYLSPSVLKKSSSIKIGGQVPEALRREPEALLEPRGLSAKSLKAPTLYNNTQVSTILRSKVYNIVSKFLINKIMFSNRINILPEDSLNYTVLFSSGGLNGLGKNAPVSQIFKQHLTILMGGKIGELFTYSGVGFKGNFYFCSAKMQVPQGHLDKGSCAKGLMSIHGIDQAWKTATALIYSFIQKRWIYQKNLLVPKFLDFAMRSSTNNGITEIPTPPTSNILLPAKRYENFKRTFYLKQQRSPSNPNGNQGLGINEQIQLHQQQRLVKRLYKVPLKEFFRSELLNTSLNSALLQTNSFTKSNLNNETIYNSLQNQNNVSYTSFSNASIILAPLEKNQQKPTKMNWFFRNRILNRHHTYLSNQWWNGQLQEHNTETTLSSDIDWRYSFIEKIGDIFIDFPDADQFYISQNRRWLNTSNSWNSWFDYDQSVYQEYYSHYIYDCLISAYKCLDQNRELLDYYVISILEKGTGQNVESVLSQLEVFSVLKRFTAISAVDK